MISISISPVLDLPDNVLTSFRKALSDGSRHQKSEQGRGRGGLT
jgi:hypothetical protein